MLTQRIIFKVYGLILRYFLCIVSIIYVHIYEFKMSRQLETSKLNFKFLEICRIIYKINLDSDFRIFCIQFTVEKKFKSVKFSIVLIVCDFNYLN